MVSRLIYGSRAAEPFSDGQLNELAAESYFRNQERGITGILHYSEEMFYQYLEGDKENLINLISVIREDSRHEIINCVDLGESNDRLLPEWHMRYLDYADMEALRVDDAIHDLMQCMVMPIGNETIIRKLALHLIRKIAQRREVLETVHA